MGIVRMEEHLELHQEVDHRDRGVHEDVAVLREVDLKFPDVTESHDRGKGDRRPQHLRMVALTTLLLGGRGLSSVSETWNMHLW